MRKNRQTNRQKEPTKSNSPLQPFRGRRTLRKAHADPCAAAGFAFQLHVRVMPGHNMLYNGKPQPRAAYLSGTALIHPVKSFKNSFLMFFGNADTRVGYLQQDSPAPRGAGRITAGFPDTDIDRSAFHIVSDRKSVV